MELTIDCVRFHYVQSLENNQGYNYNQPRTVFLSYFFFVSHDFKLLFEMSIVTVTLIFHTSFQGCFVLGNNKGGQNKYLDKLHLYKQ